MRIIFFLVFMLFSFSAMSQGFCLNHKSMNKFLENMHEEQLTIILVMSGKILYEIWAGQEGSWSIVRKDQIKSCIRATGIGILVPTIKKEGDPT